jgi:hypothetical protein
MKSFSEEQRIFLSGKCDAGYEPIPTGCPEPIRTKIIEVRARRLGIEPRGLAAPLPVNPDLAAELTALKSL